VSDANRATTDIEEVQAWAAGLDALHAWIAGRFARAEPRQRVLAYLRGLLGNVGRKNGWQSAEHAGEATPDGMQRLLATADWDPDLVRDDLRTYVVEHLGDPQAVLVVDETGFLKKGTTSVGVQRQYSGNGGKVDNCQLGVFLADASSRGRAFMDRELYLPKVWTEDQARCRAARVPEQVGFRTKAQLARILLERALEAGVPAAWVTADEVYGQDPALRGWLEGRRMAYVLAIKSSELRAVGDGPAKLSAAQLAASLAPEQWVACSAGYGAKGRRLYDWSWVDLTVPAAAGYKWWLLVRRSRRDGELAFYACYGPGDTSLVGLVRVAGLRWAIENGFQQTKNEVGLDHYEVRRWPGWYRHITLALLAHAFLVVTRAKATSATAQGGTRRPNRRARPAPAHRARGPPPAGGPGVDSTGRAWLGAGLVTLAPTPSGTSATRTLPATRTASAAGVRSKDDEPPGVQVVGPSYHLGRQMV
jgi:SRSO17 transposase